MKFKNSVFSIVKRNSNFFVFSVLVGYLLILAVGGLHHHKLNLISIKENQHLSTPFPQPEHNYDKCEIHYFANSIVSNINLVSYNYNYLTKDINSSIENDKFFYSIPIFNNFLRAPPINL